MIFYWSLSDSTSPQVHKTFLCILADLNKVIAWMVSIRSVIFTSSSTFSNLLVTVQRTSISIGIIVTFMIHCFFFSQGSGINLYFHFPSNLICGKPVQQSPHIYKFSFLLIIIRSARLAVLRCPVCISKCHRSFVRLIFQERRLVVQIPLFVRSNLNILYNSQWITLHNQPCLFLYSFSDNLLN